MIASNRRKLIVGGGNTGLSVARYLAKLGSAFDVYDTRDELSVLTSFKALDANARCFCGIGQVPELSQYDELIVSPGVPLEVPLVANAIELGVSVIGDVALFLRVVSAPVVGITGSNGKSTVTTMVGLAAEHAGMNVKVGGNLGVPALDLIANDIDLYILELSSFQLESTTNAGLDVGVVLNVSADHMDRHKTLQNYFTIKHRVYHGAHNVVYSLDDALTQPPLVNGVKRFGFGLSKSVEVREIQYHYDSQSATLMRDRDAVLEKSKVRQKGLHNLQNILSLFAICEAANIPAESAASVAASFAGLPHRCEFIRELNGITFINDSKATNVGASIAAIRGFASDVKGLYLILGGVGKGADFSELAKEVSAHTKCVLFIGEDAKKIASAFSENTSYLFCDSLQSAVKKAFELAQSGDMVLLSPACASFDMFSGFEDRGDVFRKSVEVLAA